MLEVALSIVVHRIMLIHGHKRAHQALHMLITLAAMLFLYALQTACVRLAARRTFNQMYCRGMPAACTMRDSLWIHTTAEAEQWQPAGIISSRMVLQSRLAATSCQQLSLYSCAAMLVSGGAMILCTAY